MNGLWVGIALAWLRKVLAPVLPAIAGVVGAAHHPDGAHRGHQHLADPYRWPEG